MPRNPEDLADFDRPFAHEALARAYAVAGDEQHARHHLSRARELAASIEDPDDRDLVLSDLASVDAAGRGLSYSSSSSLRYSSTGIRSPFDSGSSSRTLHSQPSP